MNSLEKEGFTYLCELNDLVHEEGKRFFVGDIEVALFRLADKVYAVSNLCSHQHAPIMCDGFIEGGYVACPAHGWKFNLLTGKMPTGRKGIDTYPVEIVDGKVFAKVEEIKVNWNW